MKASMVSTLRSQHVQLLQLQEKLTFLHMCTAGALYVTLPLVRSRGKPTTYQNMRTPVQNFCGRDFQVHSWHNRAHTWHNKETPRAPLSMHAFDLRLNAWTVLAVHASLEA